MTVVTLYHVCNVCRESVEQHSSQVEALTGKLHLAQNSAKSFETLAIERAHQISSLEKEVKVRDGRLSSLEEALSSKNAKISEMEGKMAVSSERMLALQIDKERLSQQVRW